MSWRHSEHGLFAVTAWAACLSGGAFAAPDQPQWASTWRPELGFFDRGPTCLLYPPDDIDPSEFYLTFEWNAREGSDLWVMRRPVEIASVRLESEGGGDSWAITLDPPNPRLDGRRRALLESKVAASILHSLELGRALNAVVSADNGASTRYHISAQGAQITVPMFRACMKSVTDDPPSYLFQPKREFLGSHMGGERCQFGQIIYLGANPVLVSLDAMADGGEIGFHRGLIAENPHGPFTKRKTPDRIDAQPLFGKSFDLVEDYRYDITTEQLNELATDLSRGTTRKFSLTTPGSDKSTLKFGGPLGKHFAAMFAACRTARFAEKGMGTQ